MAFWQTQLPFSVLLFLCITALVSSGSIRHYTPPIVTHLTDLFPKIPVSDGYSDFYGDSHIKLTSNGSIATLTLDKSSGSGLASKNKYQYGFFSAAIKLPPGLSSGVVVAFYLSNADDFPHNHDEIDIELLGHDRRKDWIFQTNVYANGSVNTGREEKFYLWFDPTTQHHHYSILWNSHHIVFFVDNVPVREFPRNNAVFPLKPMSVYATIWDGSQWATHGGKYPVNYKNAPFTASFTEMEMNGCVYSNQNDSVSLCSKKNNPSSLDPVEGHEFATLSKQQVTAMDWARRKLMLYSYCKDTSRFKVLPPECK
uniref:Xyloglucan endotransglucosylase/hydrolase n=1 Tax=Cannabis sativa TaxID=3483 RepID=A0A803PEU1_CANSA